MDDLVSLVDEHTGYFKSHLDPWRPLSEKSTWRWPNFGTRQLRGKLPSVARLGVSKASSLLGRLVERGAVVVLPGGGRNKRLYETSERMYNIYYLFRRRGAPSERVRAVVRFMISFYDSEQLVTVASRIADEMLALEPPDRKDHYLVYCDLVEKVSTELLRDKLVKLARTNFAKFNDIPTPLARMIGSQKRVIELPVPSRKIDRHEKKDVTTLLQKALICLKESRVSEGENACREILKVDSQSAKAWTLLGEFLLEKPSGLHEAEAAFREAIRISPHFPPAWGGLGKLLHEKLSRFDEAEDAYRKVVETDPEFAWAWVQLGQLLHEKLSRFDEAENAYRKALEIDPQYAWAWVQLGRLLYEGLSRFDEAETAFRKAIEINSQSSWTWVQLGRLLHEKLSRFDEAETAFRRAIEINPQGVWLSEVMLRFLLSRPGRRDDAVRFAETIILKWPNDHRLLNECASRLYDVGDRQLWERALMWARQAVVMSSDNGRYHYTVATIECALGNLKEALKAAESYVADVDTVANTAEDVTWLFTELAARGQAAKALQILVESPSGQQVEPLAAGIGIFLGHDVNVATEIKEIGFDVARRIEDRRKALAGARRNQSHFAVTVD